MPRADVAGHFAELIADETIINADKAPLAARSLSRDDLDNASFDGGIDRVSGVQCHEPD